MKIVRLSDCQIKVQMRTLAYTFLDITLSECKKERQRRKKIIKAHTTECTCEICIYCDWPFNLTDDDLTDFQAWRADDLPDQGIFSRSELRDMLKEYTQEDRYLEASLIARILDEMYSDGLICVFKCW